MDHRETQLKDLRHRIASGTYEIDPLAVADAIVRRGFAFGDTTQTGARVGSAPRSLRARARFRCIGPRASARRARSLAA